MAESFGQIRVWEVSVGSERGAVFEDMDVALAFLRAELRDGNSHATMESQLIDWEEYTSRIEWEDMHQ